MSSDSLPDGLPFERCDGLGDCDVFAEVVKGTEDGRECTTARGQLPEPFAAADPLRPGESYFGWRVAAIEYVSSVARAAGWRVGIITRAAWTESAYVKLHRVGSARARVRISSHAGGCRGPRQFSVVIDHAWRLGELRAWLEGLPVSPRGVAEGGRAV